ncbi:MAG: 6-bladed beta-propeller [Candidatus Kapabacteria bacterium]|nr:6-bladed beta-propeller [Candidatus Kapabacteria bacterium]
MKINKIYIVLLISYWIFFLVSCSPKIVKNGVNDLVVFPPPPDTTRIQYLTGFSNSKELFGDNSNFEKLITGLSDDFSISKPFGLSTGKNKIVICDTKLGGLEIINLENKTYNLFKPGGLGQLMKPLNCFIDKDSLLYVVDADRKDIVVFDDSLHYVKNVGYKELSKPTDVFVKDDKIYITDISDHKIRIFSKDNSVLLNSFPDVDEQDTAFIHQPSNIFVTDKEIYVTDFGEFVIKVFDLNGNFIKNIGKAGSFAGGFVRPKGISLDKDKNLYVVDAAFENVQLFNSEGEILMYFGGPYKGRGTLYLPAKVTVDYHNLDFFRKYVYKDFNLNYLVFVTNQFGPEKVSVYGFVEPK